LSTDREKKVSEGVAVQNLNTIREKNALVLACTNNG
jgi:hypothetical protein